MNRLDLYSEAGIAKRIAEGRGQKWGESYTPWLTVRDVPGSSGYRAMVYSVKFGRTIHVLSLLELGLLVYLEAKERIHELYEQCPQDRDLTRFAAKQLGYRHPQYRGVAIVMTTDFLAVEELSDGSLQRVAYSAKMSDELRRWRPVEKLKIEELSQHIKGQGFNTITEENLPRDLVLNLRSLRIVHRPGMMAGYTPQIIESVAKWMGDRVWDRPWADLCSECDRALSLPPDLRSIRAAQWLVSTGHWRVNLNHRIQPNLPLVHL